jgi:hypothetical protein
MMAGASSRRPVRLPSELVSDSKTLRYEIDMLLGAAAMYTPNTTNVALKVKNNAAIESFALHCRSLIFFFYAHQRTISDGSNSESFCVRPNDVLAVDFDPGWTSRCPTVTSVLVSAKRQADKHIAHITTERRDVNQSGSAKRSVWNFQNVTSDIVEVAQVFLRAAPSHHFDQNVLCHMLNTTAAWNAAQGSIPTSSSHPRPVFQIGGVSMHAKTE